MGGILTCAIADNDERVVHDVLCLGAIAENADRDRAEGPCVPVVQGSDCEPIAPLEPMHQFEV
jgi:hypothetical protein